MNSEVVVRDRNNITIGWCRDYGNVINAIHIRKGYVGYYNKNSDITFDKNGRVYAYGDATQTLIRDADK